jgi:hypothetical protein
MGWTWRGIGVWVVVLAGCGPTVDDGGIADEGSESESSGADPTATSTSVGSTSASSTTSADETSESDGGSSSSADGLPPPPEGGEIGEGGDCSCCGSSLRVTWPSDASEFTVALVSEQNPPFFVTCPAATVEGLDSVEIGCGIGEITLRTDGLAASFDEGSWRVTIDDEQPVSAPSVCDFGPPCDCNCLPSDCQIAVESER